MMEEEDQLDKMLKTLTTISKKDLPKKSNLVPLTNFSLDRNLNKKSIQDPNLIFFK